MDRNVVQDVIDIPGRTTGCDECGMGAIAGPVVAGAVILPKDFDLTRITGRNGKLRDSKKMQKKRIPEAAAYIRKTCHVGIGRVSAKVTDRIGIRAATRKAMRSAVRHLARQHSVDDIIVDGIYPVPGFKNQTPVVKADIIHPCVCAASLVAKAYRDRLMRRQAKKYPQYGFNNNVGYLTREHGEAIKKFGPCNIHRRSYGPISKNLGNTEHLTE